MLSKCANPACSNVFRYLREGKLFLIEFEARPGKSDAASQKAGTCRAIDYAWLCSSCCRDMTVGIDAEDNVRVIRKSEEQRSRAGSA